MNCYLEAFQGFQVSAHWHHSALKYALPSLPSEPPLSRHIPQGKFPLSSPQLFLLSQEMVIDQIPYDPTDDEYIDMDISSSTFVCYSITSPTRPNREFEFQMSSNPHETESTTSPADELFYNGKLLPLHLPPRLKMVEKLLQNTNCSTHDQPLKTQSFEENISTNTTTPFESCNISPSDSCQVSRELNPDEYFYECVTENAGFIDDHRKKSWSKKLKLIKHSSLGVKLKASRAFLKSLFSKSGCSDETCAAAARTGDEYAISKEKESLNKDMKVAKKNPFGQIQRERYHVEDNGARAIVAEKVAKGDSEHRRSFSGVIKWYSGTKSLSSSSSNYSSSSSSSSSSSADSHRFYELPLLKRTSSANSEGERSIQGAIAHCKQSQQLFSVRKSGSEVGFC